jgi:hypothetical protein
MASSSSDNRRSGVLSSIGATAMRPITGAVGAAAEAGINLSRGPLDRLIDSGELDSLLKSPRLHAAVEQVLESEGAATLVDEFFDSGLFAHFVDRLLASDALWHLVDEIAGSPAVTAAISQQGLGFADQVGDQLRARSRQADDWLEGRARRLVHFRQRPEATKPNSS